MKSLMSGRPFPGRLGSLLVAGLIGLGGPAVAQAAADEETLWEALGKGGKVVMMRHTESAEADPEVSMHLSPERDCGEEQELSEAGKAQAEALRGALEDRGIRAEEVLSSELCRARQTAERAFGEFETWDALNLLQTMPEGEQDWLMEDVRDRIGGFDGEGNLFLISHRGNINTVVFENVEPGSLVVVRPEGFGSHEVLGEIPLEAYYGAGD
ncbi:histidine phosphatase family protein [Thioalkalivibrio sp. AKL17]|uniref:histidine phosphatase family protein n=1 Tax=Thioalkalivibrio sp. AKL17 TaxID=1158160 RepID=UPI0003745D47|nr:histidine phosphatase family protein [Thioalkalivibrio sp. AKL17]